MEPMYVLSFQLFALYVIAFIGFFCAKKQLLPTGSENILSNLLLYVTLPCLIINSLNIPFSYAQAFTAFTMLILSVYYLIMAIVLSRFLNKKLNKVADRNGVFQNLLIFGNQGFIGMAIISALFGADALFIATVFNLIYFLLIWSYAIMIMTPNDTARPPFTTFLKNPGFLATFTGFVLFIVPFQIPSLIASPIQMLGDMTIPLSMLVIGVSLSSITADQLRSLIREPLLYLTVMLRNLILPGILFIPLFFLSIFPQELLVIALLLAAMPCAHTITIYAIKYGGDTNFSSTVVLLSTFMTIITIPALYFLTTFL
ncbi:AEC family transporter [Salicibibacter cibarius]|uniref:AEC family transporter n=1 Tax=Salicibibacter cibarius TaxID=2743000 RepID=A0A7T6Z2T1_9BACI|nr:AEC family transporter [Salicibibacter cibarius]QQK75296.1 AEC family transporter [Salicibibacter cibarius]